MVNVNRLRSWCAKALPYSALLITLLGFSGVSTEAQEHKIVTIDAPGADQTAGNFNGTFASGINNWGVITGSYLDINDVNYGFIRSPEGKFITFQAPGADTTAGSFNGTSPNAINDLGVVTGQYYDASGTAHGFLRSPEGRFTSFDVNGAGGFGTIPIAINLEGSVVGYYSDTNSETRAFVRFPDGRFATYVGPNWCDSTPDNGCFGNAAFSINISGTAAGGFEDNSGNFVNHGLIRRPDGKLETFDVSGAGTGAYQGTGCPGCIVGENQWGAIAGTWIDSNNVIHGFLRSPGGEITKFDAPGAGTGAGQGTGCPSDCPVSLNDFGAITGVYTDVNNTLHGFLRNANGKTETFDPTGSQDTLPFSINDWGAITGYYLDANGVFHGFVRLP